MDATRLADLPAYQYKPLHRQYFRVIHLYPGKAQQDLKFGVQTLKLGFKDFSAVSYVWGNPNRIHKVYAADIRQGNNDESTETTAFHCNNASSGFILITDNLRQALLGLRSEEDTLVLWIDSLCINQDDTAEKSHQVQQMMNIFGQASMTKVYIGESDDVMKLAFTGIRAFASLKDYTPQESAPSLLKMMLLRVPSIPGPQWNPKHPVYIANMWDMFLAFLELPWFHRIWIVQEIVLSRQLLILAGKTSLRWEILIQACEVIDRGGFHENFDGRQHVHIPLTLERARCASHDIPYSGREGLFSFGPPQIEELPANHLLALQIRSRGCGASDPRDQVFALLGIAKAHSGSLPPVDYSMTLTEVYTRAAYALYQNSEAKPLDFLRCVNGSYDVGDLPTWVPDWRRRWETRSFAASSRIWSPKHSSCHHLRSIRFPDMTMPRLVLPLILTVRGIQIQTIKAVELIKAPFTWRKKQHSYWMNTFPEPYPTTYMTYMEAWVAVIGPVPKGTFGISGPPSEGFWSYKARDPSRPRIRPIFRKDKDAFRRIDLPLVAKFHDGPSSKPSIYLRDSNLKRGPTEPHYTQSDLYSRISPTLLEPQMNALDGYTRSRVWFITEDGFMGLALECTKPGDALVHLFGSNTPHVLRRKRQDGGKTIWGYVGDAYTLGLMHGEAEHGFPEEMVEDFEME